MRSSPASAIDERKEKMRQVRDDVLYAAALPLYGERIKNKYYPVIGQGSHYAKIMFVGEAPGRNEAETSVPFCGAAGKILDSLLASIDIKREDVYITNIVKDRPPSNRDPLPEEIAAYAPFLDRQIEIIQPKVIATLGRFSMAYIMRTFGLADKLDSISRIHGMIFEAAASYGTVTIIPLYHPAVTIYNPATREALEKDFQLLKQYQNI